MRVFVRACICAIARNEHFFTSLSKHTARFYCPELPCPAEAVVKGDSHVAAISAASIIAKVARDREMIELDAQYPGYGLAGHKGGGYPSPAHLAALKRLGVTPTHRRSLAPVRRRLA